MEDFLLLLSEEKKYSAMYLASTREVPVAQKKFWSLYVGSQKRLTTF